MIQETIKEYPEVMNQMMVGHAEYNSTDKTGAQVLLRWWIQKDVIVIPGLSRKKQNDWKGNIYGAAGQQAQLP